MSDILTLVQERRSVRGPFDPERPISMSDLRQILEAARWSPTAHNMQNFEILVIDAKEVLAKLGDISSPASKVFIRENYAQLASSEEELLQKKVGILGTMFPAAWKTPGANFEEVARESGPSFLKDTIKDSPTVLIVTYDARKRAPASEGDVLVTEWHTCRPAQGGLSHGKWKVHLRPDRRPEREWRQRQRHSLSDREGRPVQAYRHLALRRHGEHAGSSSGRSQSSGHSP